VLAIKTARIASLDNIDTKHHEVINKIIDWSNQLCTGLRCDFYGLYVRGSVPLGCATSDSDLDIAVLLSHSSLNLVLSVKASLTALIALYIWPCAVHVKVFNVDSHGYVEPPAHLPDLLKELSTKYITFDLHANGVCYAGNKIADATAIYESCAEFTKINQMMWGLEIQELIDNMKHKVSAIVPSSLTRSCEQSSKSRVKDDGTMAEATNNHQFGSHHYYPLIKKCIRLTAYIDFNADRLYYGSTEDCFQFSIMNHNAIKNELVFLYDYFKYRTIDWSNHTETLHRSIEIVSEYLGSWP